MLSGTAEFICDCDEYEVMEAYSALFIEPICEDEVQLRGEEEEVLHQVLELKEACSGSVEKGRLLIFATLVPSGIGQRLIPDISSMRWSQLENIPFFMRSHPRLEPGEDIPADTGGWLSAPLLLTPLEDITASTIYIPDGVRGYAPLTIAALLYELTAFGDDISDSERRRLQIADELGGVIGISDSAEETLDELLCAMKPPPSAEECSHAGTALKELDRLRYNARLEVYERMHSDIMLATKTRRR